jgi:CPA2 family monovalent cation:H+ antiporter-2
LTIVGLAPVVAIWRNLSAMAMLYAEVTAQGHANERRLRVFIEHGLRILAGAGMYVWLSSILPVEGLAKWLLPIMALTAILSLVLLRRRLIFWHSEMEVELQTVLAAGSGHMSSGAVPWLEGHDEWNFAMIDCVLPDLADCRGRSLRELDLRGRHGATVVGIERQGFMISLPGPDSVLYPRDKVLLMGTPGQTREAAQQLQRVSNALDLEQTISDIRMEKVVVTEGSRALGLNLAQLAPSARFGIQVAGLFRNGKRQLNPPSEEILRVGDELLCLGTSIQLGTFSDWLASELR